MDFSSKKFFLAPMSGFSNSAFRRLCVKFGADATVSEFVYSRAVLSGAAAVMKKISFSQEERPYGIQLFGSDPSEMAEACSFLEERFSPDFIDINFGCPAPTAVCAGAGSALLKSPDKMVEIVSTCSSALKRTPLAAKMRLGWSERSIIVPEAALLLEAAGARAITLHGRTKLQGYAGDADWEMIDLCARSLKIPLIGNGSAEKLSGDDMRSSACSGFMIGRGALGNPWIFENMKRRMEGQPEIVPSRSERLSAVLEFAVELCSESIDGVSDGDFTRALPQILAFLKGFRGFKNLRRALSGAKTLSKVREVLTEGENL